jgi:hypothetical protein
MRLGKTGATILTVVSLILCAVQGVVWAKSIAQARSETDEQIKETRRPPNELPGLAGMGLLVLSGVLLSVPDSRATGESTEQEG